MSSRLRPWCYFLILSAWWMALGSSIAAEVERPTAREIMERVDSRDDGDSAVQDLEMILLDRRGRQRLRKLQSFRLDQGVDELSMMFFLAPADIEDTGFLTYDYHDPEQDDDQWLYLPALNRTRRIAASDKSGSFMGSDFSYADMTDRPLDHYDYRLMKETQLDGHPVWQIEATPVTEREQQETGYLKSVLFIRKDNNVVVRGLYWVKKGNRLKYYEVKNLEQIDGIWTETEMHMTTKKGKETLHKTVLRSANIRFNQDLSPDFFTVRQLESGP